MEGYSFVLTTDPVGGKHHNKDYAVRPIDGTKIIRHGESMKVVIHEKFPRKFYYQCVEYSLIGGYCEVHENPNTHRT